MKIYIVRIWTEDGEAYYYTYSYEPTKKEVYDKFIEEFTGTYTKTWLKNNSGYDIYITNLIEKCNNI